MQTRTCFNGGELSAAMAARCDVDVYMRGCCVLENWQVGQMGGVRRRRGMRGVGRAMDGESRLVSYVYSYADDDACFLVELGRERVRVFSAAGVVVADFASGEDGVPEFCLDVDEVRVKQLNALLFVTCRVCWPMVLRWDGGDGWFFERVVFKELPWRYEFERREHPVSLVARAGESGVVYEVGFADEEDEEESEVEGVADWLRVSFWLDEAEARERGAVLRAGVRVVTGLVGCKAGECVALHGEEVVRYWSCKQEFPKDVYVTGLDDPGCYPDNFVEAESLSGVGEAPVVTSVKALGTVARGTLFGVKCGYWEYFTCVRDFTESDMVAGQSDYADYAGFFVRGIAVGEALPCRGKWRFFCSGLWYGCYEVRRSFSGSELTAEWESAGVSFSRLQEAENAELAGDEGGEECYLRLFLTRSKWLSDDPADGFPLDSCGNRLVVDGYRHDMVLELDGYGVWRCRDRVKVGWLGRREVWDWSWAAFSERYGFPLEVEVYAQRLVFLSTEAQPQSLWMSRTDDLYNFAPSDADDGAIALTLCTESQNPVCWAMVYRDMLMLGTAEAEWVVQPREGAVVAAGQLAVGQHQRIGSAGGLMLPVDGHALFVERGGGRLWSFGYSFEVDGCRGTDLTVFAPHVLGEHGGVRGCALLEKPDRVAVFALGDGQVALCTYNVEHQVKAWSRWVTDGVVLDVAVLPAGVGEDRLFLLVRRDDGVWVECVDGDSPYVDRGGRGYVSVLMTNALVNPLERRVERMPKVPAMLLLGGDVPTAALQVCADGGEWTQVATHEPLLRAGWLQVLVFNRWEYAHALGVRCVGEVGCELLALQG